jgi:predicted outer membrane repeat protein
LRVECLEERVALRAYTVNVATDQTDGGGGAGTTGDLRYCITQANLELVTSTIGFTTAVLGETINLGIVLPPLRSGRVTSITGVTTVLGQPGVTVRRSATATTDFPIFQVGIGATVTIQDLIISYGTGVVSLMNATGGGVYNQGTLTLTNDVVSNNSVTAKVASGGGIYNDLVGTLTLNGTTVTQNRALKSADAGAAASGGGIYNLNKITVQNGSKVDVNNSDTYGGGIFIAGSNTTTIENSTVSGNTARDAGGGIYHSSTSTSAQALKIRGSSMWNNQALGGKGIGGGIFTAGKADIANTTLENNTAKTGGAIYGTKDALEKLILKSVTNAKNKAIVPGPGAGVIQGNDPPAGVGGGLYLEAGGEVDMANTIIATNTADSSAPDVSGTVNSLGINLIGISDGSSGWLATDLLGSSTSPLDPLLDPLGDYGGPTLSMTLQASSPALRAGDPNQAEGDTDQRGYARLSGPYIDIGAVEMQQGTNGSPGGINLWDASVVEALLEGLGPHRR